MKKSILRIGIMGVAVAVVVAFLLVGCDDAASMNNDGAVDGFLVRVNEKPVMSGGDGSGVYKLTVISDGSGATRGGNYPAGMTIDIYAGETPAGYVKFEKWITTSPGVKFVKADSASTSFDMPANDVTVTAIFWKFSNWGTFTDVRDQKKYKTTTINGKRWMAENLNYLTSSDSWCYSGSADSCAKYGRLYDWETAKTVCPTGWHLPSRDEWGALAIAAGGTGTYGADGAVGKALKSTSGWNGNGNGTDSFGFSALPGGYRSFGGGFYDAGNRGHWWTATEAGSGNPYYRYLYYNYDKVGEYNENKSYGFSVRCREDL